MLYFMSGGLKDNISLYKGVLTGILRIAKESIFSGLNNLSVYSLLNSKFNKYFGLTIDEVEKPFTIPSQL
ncbi:MAG: AAA family ATPase [Halanaerobiales bacterium]|nr:AAA family ATPase [Halanaerobiales bacterium]